MRKDTVFGPYAGITVLNYIEAHESGYSWQVRLHLPTAIVNFLILILITFALAKNFKIDYFGN